MKRRDESRQFDFSGREAQLPGNFGERLTAIKERSGLTWEGMAEAVAGRQRLTYRAGQCEFPDDFPWRLERLRAASGLTWRELPRGLGVNVRSLYRWRAGGKPDAAHLLALLEFARDRELLDCLLEHADRGERDERQALLFDADVWARLGDEPVPDASNVEVHSRTALVS